MSDNTYLEAAQIVLRPFIDEVDGVWRTVRGVCIASFIVAVCLWFFSYIASPEHFERAKFILNATGWFSFIIFIFSYGTLYWEVIQMGNDKLAERHRKVGDFTDVEKK